MPDCPLCQEPLTNGNEVGAPPCGHPFHFHCVEPVVTLIGTCPECGEAASDVRLFWVDLAHLPPASRETELQEQIAIRDVEIQAAEQEVQQLTLQQEASRQAHRANLQEQEVQIEIWRHRLEVFDDRDNESQEMRELAEQVAEAQLAAMEELREDAEERYGELLNLHRDMRSASAEIHQRLTRDNLSLTKASIFYVPERAIADPRQAVDDLFQCLGMQVGPEHARVLGCEQMLNHPSWQILIDFTDEFAKLETLVKFPRVSQHPQPDMRGLKLRDWMFNKHLLRKAKEELKGMPEIGYVGVKSNQVAYRRINDQHYHEIESEADLARIKSEALGIRAARAAREQEAPVVAGPLDLPPPPPNAMEE